MREFEPDPIQEEIREERQEIKQKTLIFDMYVPRGHTVFTYNRTTHEVKAAVYKAEKMLDLGRVNEGTDGAILQGVLSIGKIEFDDNLIYFPALNLKNAKKKSADVDSFFQWLDKKAAEKENRDTL